MERLTDDDARILRLESDVIAGHTLKVALVEPADGREPPAPELVRRRVQSRLARLRRGRQRLALTPLGLATPAWVDDVSFDIRRHVRLASEPVHDAADVVALAGKVMAERLDHSRPLWCVDYAGPLDDGRIALIIRIHHCMADGVTALRFLKGLLWDDDVDDPGEPSSWAPAPEPGAARLLVSGLGSRARDLGGAISGGARTLASPRRWRESGRELATLPATLRRELWPLGADTAFDRRIGGDRELAFTSCSLADLKRIEHAAGEHVTINDVVLAMVAGAIRRWISTHHEHMETMRVQIPVSMHHRDEDGDALGNRDSFLFCDLPISEPDPRARLAAINAETTNRKEHHDPDELYSFFHSLSHVRPLYKVASGFAAGPREFALSVSNVPGPREPISLLGGNVGELYSAAEPADRHALRASAISLAGRMGLGFCTDPGAVPGVADLADGLDESLEELLNLC
ncbi:MAG: wax ester/triacylglycerol synthase domain-containing protein [Solirubrobacterales bacterium]